MNGRAALYLPKSHFRFIWLVGVSGIAGVVIACALTGDTLAFVVEGYVVSLLLWSFIFIKLGRGTIFSPLSLWGLQSILGLLVPGFYCGLKYSCIQVGRVHFDNAYEGGLWMTAALLVIWLAFICFVLGAKFGQSVRPPHLRGFEHPWSFKRLYKIAILMTTLGVGSWLVYLTQGGGVVYWFTHIGERWQLQYGKIQYWRWGIELLPLSALVLACGFVTQRRRVPRLTWCIAGLAAFALLSLGSRGAALEAIVMLAIATSVRVPTKYMFLTLGIIASAILIGGNLYRGVGIFPTSLVDGHYGGLDVLILFLRDMPEKMPWLLGKTLLYLFVWPIPRQLWPEKPVAISRLVAEKWFPGLGGGPSTPFLAELYANLWLSGVIIGMFVIGFFLAWLFKERFRYTRAPAWLAVYTIGCLYGWGLAGGDFLQVTVRFLERLLVVLGVNALCRIRKQPQMSVTCEGSQYVKT